jgi:hypothetical protein
MRAALIAFVQSGWTLFLLGVVAGWILSVVWYRISIVVSYLNDHSSI